MSENDEYGSDKTEQTSEAYEKDRKPSFEDWPYARLPSSDQWISDVESMLEEFDAQIKDLALDIRGKSGAYVFTGIGRVQYRAHAALWVLKKSIKEKDFELCAAFGVELGFVIDTLGSHIDKLQSTSKDSETRRCIVKAWSDAFAEYGQNPPSIKVMAFLDRDKFEVKNLKFRKRNQYSNDSDGWITESALKKRIARYGLNKTPPTKIT
jgi:hypothetical protein